MYAAVLGEWSAMKEGRCFDVVEKLLAALPRSTGFDVASFTAWAVADQGPNSATTRSTARHSVEERPGARDP
jgi:hypothetical protein